jgi:hypothetical protein
MATRTRKTASPSTPPAKKTTTKKTTARAPRKTTTKKTTPTPALSLVKPGDTTTTATVVDLRDPLPVRRRYFVGTHSRARIVEARACLASAAAQLPIPHLLWLAQIDGRATARLADGTYLVHTHERAPEFTAYLRCPTGGLHTELVTNDRDLKAARAITKTCRRRHDGTDPAAGGYDWHKAATLGVQKLIPARLSPLNAGLKTAKKAMAKTQPMNTAEIAEGLAQRAAANTNPGIETAKEHPEP